MISGKGRRGSRRCGAAAFAAPFGRKPYGATSCRARLPRHRPQPVPAVTPRCRATRAGPGRHARAECAVRRAKGHSHRAGMPRIIQVGPSSVKGTRRSFLTASQKGSSGPTLERRSLCRPSGPDGEGQARGQARNARGEPPLYGGCRENQQSGMPDWNREWSMPHLYTRCLSLFGRPHSGTGLYWLVTVQLARGTSGL